MATLQDFRDERIKKLEKLRDLGIDTYPAKSSRTIGAGEIKRKFEELENTTQTVAGRIVSLRKFGKLAFIVIRDASGEIQLFIRDGDVENLDATKSQIGISELNLLDTGDFIEANGEIIKTKTGEISVGVKTLRILTKALRPLPGRDGLSNKEERLRRRYIDMNVNLEVRERFIRRSKFWQATRDFLNERGFNEVNIPVLEHTTGGADANPFTTHLDALDEDVYLRISHELPLKRLIGAGFEKVYDIGPRFRNEGIDDEHLPEHIAMESYAAYQNYEDGMKFYEEMIKYVAQKTWNRSEFVLARNFAARNKIDEIRENIMKNNSEKSDNLSIENREKLIFDEIKKVAIDDKENYFYVNLDQSWPKISYEKIMFDRFGIDVFAEDTEENREKLRQILRENNREFDSTAGVSRLLDNCWKIIRETSAGPFWLIHEPVSVSPLAKRLVEDNRVTERFHPIILGTEMGNGFSELNDPQDQLARFIEQQNLRDAGDKEAMMLDIDFVEMLEYGLPPTCGWGNSERNFWLLEGVTGREGVPFPMMRHEISEVTKKIYPNVKF